MYRSVAFVKTGSGQKYLVQLCKHFAHKITVVYSESHGDCRFPRGGAVLDADVEGLRMVVTSDEEQGLAEIQAIIDSHLVRFAFREKIETIDWQRQTETV